jgi:hypothetical protein
LKDVIEAKQAEIERLITTNKNLKENEEIRLRDIKNNNLELKEKIE